MKSPARQTRSQASGGATTAVDNSRSRELRVVIMSHSHPQISSGGAEIAAYQQFSLLRQLDGMNVTFIAAGSGRIPPRDGVQFSQPFGPGEYVYVGPHFDHFIHANPDPKYPAALASLLKEINPHIVHLHHYTNFGVETFLHIRRAVPDAKIVVTLHEYLAICNHFGQMVKRPSFRLCDRASPRDCAKCFPERSEQDFFLREKYLKRFFRLVDHFISPSAFLADRYAQWGLDSSRISVIENGMPIETSPAQDSASIAARAGLCLGFFGQISVLKGINVIIDAARLLEASGVDNVRFEIHGDYSGQPPAFREQFEKDLENAPSSFVYMGPYPNRAVQKIMGTVDAVLVPSIWWENSPLVIQEAFRAGRPVICSDIGGMAEKVRDGLDGFHFQAGSPAALAGLVKSLIADPEALVRVRRTIQTPPTIEMTVRDILSIYKRLNVARPSAPERGLG